MTIEAGSCCAMVGPDDVTFAFLKGRPYAPKDLALEEAITQWRTLVTDADAIFDREIIMRSRRI